VVTCKIKHLQNICNKETAAVRCSLNFANIHYNFNFLRVASSESQAYKAVDIRHNFLKLKTRGHSWKIHKQRRHLDVQKYFFSDRVVDQWNKLDQDIVDCESVNGFKNRLEKWRDMKMGFFMD